MRLLSALRRRTRSHACRYELPTVQLPADPHTDDDRDFDSDLTYLRLLEEEILREYSYNTRALVTPADVKCDIANLEMRYELSEELYGTRQQAGVWPHKRAQYRADQLDYIGEALL